MLVVIDRRLLNSRVPPVLERTGRGTIARRSGREHSSGATGPLSQLHIPADRWARRSPNETAALRLPNSSLGRLPVLLLVVSAPNRVAAPIPGPRRPAASAAPTIPPATVEAAPPPGSGTADTAPPQTGRPNRSGPAPTTSTTVARPDPCPPPPPGAVPPEPAPRRSQRRLSREPTSTSSSPPAPRGPVPSPIGGWSPPPRAYGTSPSRFADQWAVTAGLRLRDEAIEIASWTLRHGDRSTTVRPVLPVPDLVLPASAGTTWDKTSYDLQAGAAIRSTGRYLERQAVPLCGTLVDAPTEARPTMRGAAAAVALVLLAAACGRHDRPPPIAVHVADFTAPDGIIMAEERGIDERLARAGDDALIGAARLWRLERGGRIVGTPAGGHVGAGGRSGRRRGAGNTAGCGAHRSSRGAISWRYDREAQRRAQCFRRRAAGSHPGELVHPCRVRPAQPARGPRPSPDSQFRGAATRRAGR